MEVYKPTQMNDKIEIVDAIDKIELIDYLNILPPKSVINEVTKEYLKLHDVTFCFLFPFSFSYFFFSFPIFEKNQIETKESIKNRK